MVFGHGFGLELAQGAFDHLKRIFIAKLLSLRPAPAGRAKAPID